MRGIWCFKMATKKAKLRKKIKTLKKLKLIDEKKALQTEINRRKLLMALKGKPINIMAKVEDKIPHAFSEEHSIIGKREKTKLRFLKGGLI